jgi:hypothetical protein
MKSLAFICCEKVIQDSNGQASIISLIQAINIAVVVPMPSNAIGPTNWAIFAVWDITPEEYDKQFNQIFHVLWPDGTEFTKTSVSFLTNRVGRAVIYAIVQGFPYGQAGKVLVRGWVESEGVIVSDTQEYSIGVTHTTPPAVPVSL